MNLQCELILVNPVILPPVNVGSRFMWTFHQERNLLYIACTKLLWLIWANIQLLWATQCQAYVTTIRFKHVVHGT